MHATIPQPELAAAAKWAARQLPVKLSQPVLHGARLEATGDRLKISVWDGTTAAHATVDADVEQPGFVVASGRTFSDVVAALGKTDVTLADTGDGLAVTTDRAEFSLPTLPAADYPALPAIPDGVGTVDGDELAAGFKRIKDAISRTAEGSTAGMRGVRLVADSGRLEMCATDRYRIATTWIGWDGPDGGTGVLPGRALADAVAAFTGRLHVALPAGGLGTAALVGERHQITTVLMDWETFPHRVHEVSPSDKTISGSIEADAEELKAAVQAAILADGKALHLAVDSRHGTVHAAGDTRGRIRVAAVYSGDQDGVELKIEPPYLVDALAQFTGSIRIDVTTPARPFRIVDPDDDTYRHVIMPLKPTAAA
ncbi:hypothetical protein ABZ819_04920 [Streptomyces venezuelae]|uniref:DNA polymerase III subunit beta n=1 Tax=Streptomyces venezuelae TaxID=54571 RepID=UPI0034177090